MSDPMFPFFVNDWLGSGKVRSMTLAQRAGYFQLLLHSWNSPESDCGLPADDDALASFSELGQEWHNGAKAKIMRCFVVEGERIYNPKLRKIWNERQAFKKKCADAGRAGAPNRWPEGKQHVPEQVPVPERVHSPSPSPSLIPEEYPPTPQGGLQVDANLNGSSSTPEPKPKRRKKIYSTIERVKQNSNVMTRMNRWLRRRPDHLWTLDEAEALDAIGRNGGCHEDDMKALEAYYTAQIPDADNIRRRDLKTLLNNWQGEIDRANGWKHKMRLKGRTA